MKTKALTVLMLLLGSGASLFAQEVDRFFYQYFTGSIGEDAVYLHLQHIDGQFTGYYHKPAGALRLLEGWTEDDRIKLQDRPAGPAADAEATFNLEWGYGNQLSGLRVSTDSSQQQTVVLHPGRPAVSFEPLVREYLFQKTSIGNQQSAEVQTWEFPLSYWLLLPVAKPGLSPEVQDSLSRKLLDCPHTHQPDVCLNLQALEAYSDAAAENTLPAVNFSLQRQQYILYQSPQLVVVKQVESSFWGGAHGNHSIRYLNLDLNTGQNISLGAIFRPEQLSQLAALIHQRAPIPTRLDNVKNSLEQFYLTPGGIGFTFNTYTIASYADGPQEFYFSYAELLEALGSVAVAKSYVN